MRITDHHLKTVAFLCWDVESDHPGVVRRVPIGTAFFVLVMREDEEGSLGYAVTARHCVEAVGDRPLYLRVNVEDGYEDIETRREDWYLHDTEDVAVAPFMGKQRPGGYNLNAIFYPGEFVDADYRYRPDPGQLRTLGGDSLDQMLPTNEVPVQPGHEVFFVGLFSQHYGVRQNLPVVRFGNVSRMPIEPIWFRRPDGTFTEQLAYLVESRSWGGFSGSPVYWRHPAVMLVPMDMPDGTPWEIQKQYRTGKVLGPHPEADIIAFLGIVSGHFDIDQPGEATGDFQGTITTRINSGIAVVTPAGAIDELFMREDVVANRKEIADRANAAAQEQGAVTPDTVNPQQGFTREQFMGDLTQATRRLDDEPEKEQS